MYLLKFALSLLSSRSNAYCIAVKFSALPSFSSFLCASNYKCQAARKAVNDGNMSSAAGGVASVGRVQLKLRKTLKGHLAKIYAMHWSADSRYWLLILSKQKQKSYSKDRNLDWLSLDTDGQKIWYEYLVLSRGIHIRGPMSYEESYK